MFIRMPRPWQRLILVAIALVCIVALGAWWMSQRTPTYWKQNRQFIEQTADDDLQQLANDIERRFASLTRVTDSTGRPQPAEQTLRFTVQEANAWLTRNLPRWLANQNAQLPDGIDAPMVAFDNERLILAFEYSTPRVRHVVSLVFSVELDGADGARVVLEEMRGGLLPLPRDAILEKLTASAPPNDPLVGLLHGEPFEPVWPLDASREARLLNIAFVEDGVELTIRRQARSPESEQP